jgi:branched-chain amino acid transport system ATP-binding protein
MALLEVRDAVMSFGGKQALSEVSLEADPGRVTGLIGPNGAGKTTLFNVVCGLIRPERGTVRVAGTDATRLSPTKRARLGLARTFQRLELFGMLSVRENVDVAVETYRSWAKPGRKGPVVGEQSDNSVDARVDELLGLVGLTDVAADRATSLPTGRGRLLELARALACNPRVLLLDEPAAGQTEEETTAFSRLLVQLANDGLAVVLVEHDMRLVMDVCQQVYVLDYGRLLAVGPPEEIRNDQAVRDAYLGTEAEPAHPVAVPAAPLASPAAVTVGDALSPDGAAPNGGVDDDVLLSVRDLRAGYEGVEALHGVSLQVRAGDVHAVLGPNGAGKTTLLKVIAGLHRPTSGEVWLAGFPLDRAPTATLARAGVCLIPEGRGIFPNLTVRENLAMMSYTGKGLAEIQEVACDRFPLLAGKESQVAGTLSGGEQQMLAMARALTTDPTFLLLDELSMGLAPLVVSQLYDLVGQVAASGVSILLVEQFARVVLDVASDATLIAHGDVVDQGPPHQLEHTLTEAYLGG